MRDGRCSWRLRGCWSSWPWRSGWPAGGPAGQYSLLIALGMAASFVGDLIMAEYIRTPERVAFGIFVFGIAHLFYIAAIVVGANALAVRPNAPVLAGFIALGTVIWTAWVRSPQMPAAMNWAVLVYTFVISAMAGLAVALAVAEPDLWRLGFGATLFLASDAILANHIFRRNNWLLVSDVVWLLYISGQALIVWSNTPVLGMLG